jgi:hypothetical protein
MLKLTQTEIISRFGWEAKCRVSYKNKKRKVETKICHVDWKNAIAITVLFDKPKSYLVDGDEAIRDGVRIIVG